MSSLIRSQAREGKKEFVCSSGGNAGHAASWVCQRLGVPIRIIVPETTTKLMVNKIRATGGEFTTVEIHGKNWNEADAKAQGIIRENPEAAYVHPFSSPKLREGYATMLEE